MLAMPLRDEFRSGENCGVWIVDLDELKVPSELGT
jgi:hypothetical protein